MDNNAEDKLISVREAAKECDRNPETIRRWIWSGKLPAEKLGNQLFIRRSILKNFCLGIMVTHQEEQAVSTGAADLPKPEIAPTYPSGKRQEILLTIQSLREQIRERAGQLDIDKYVGQLRGDI